MWRFRGGGRGFDSQSVAEAHAGDQTLCRQLSRTWHKDADLDMAERLTINSKCQRQGVCNACESLLVHADAAAPFLPRIGRALCARGIEIRGDRRTVECLAEAAPATEEDYYAEYLGPVCSVKVVASLEEAIEHINRYGSHHTDAIITGDLAAARRFAAAVDSAP